MRLQILKIETPSSISFLDNLKTALLYSTALKIEIKIWDIWITHPTEKKLTRLLAKGSNLMVQRKLEESYKIFSKVICT